MKELIEQIARALVDKPEVVSVAVTEEELKTVFQLRVDPSDLGKVIGKMGKTVQSIRRIVEAGGKKQEKHFHFEILE